MIHFYFKVAASIVAASVTNTAKICTVSWECHWWKMFNAEKNALTNRKTGHKSQSNLSGTHDSAHSTIHAVFYTWLFISLPVLFPYPYTICDLLASNKKGSEEGAELQDNDRNNTPLTACSYSALVSSHSFMSLMKHSLIPFLVPHTHASGKEWYLVMWDEYD